MDYGEKRIQTGNGTSKDIFICGEDQTIDDAPSEAKIIIDSNIVNSKPSEIVNSMEGNEINKGPSVNAVKEFIDNKTNLEVIGWNNPNPTSLFSSQTITLTDNISNYSYYEIYYKGWRANPHMLTTGKIPVEWGTCLSYYESTGVLGMRTLDKPTGNTMKFGNMTGNGVDNNYTVPYKIILYKKEVSE